MKAASAVLLAVALGGFFPQTAVAADPTQANRVLSANIAEATASDPFSWRFRLKERPPTV